MASDHGEKGGQRAKPIFQNLGRENLILYPFFSVIMPKKAFLSIRKQISHNPVNFCDVFFGQLALYIFCYRFILLGTDVVLYCIKSFFATIVPTGLTALPIQRNVGGAGGGEFVYQKFVEEAILSFFQFFSMKIPKMHFFFR